MPRIRELRSLKGSMFIPLMLVVIMAAIIGVMTMTSLQVASNEERSARIDRVNTDLALLQLFIRNNTSCNATFSTLPAACAAGGGPLTLKQYPPLGGNLVGPGPPYTTVGAYSLRATCPACSGPCPTCVAPHLCPPPGFKVKVEAYRAVGRAFLSSLQNQLNDSTNGWIDIFPKDPPPCVP